MLFPAGSVPLHLFFQALKRLDYRELLRLSQTCRTFNIYIGDNLHLLQIICPLELHITMRDNPGEVASIDCWVQQKDCKIDLMKYRFVQAPPIKFKKIVLHSTSHFLFSDFNLLKNWLSINPVKCQKFNLWNLVDPTNLEIFFETFKNDSNLRYESLLSRRMSRDQFYKIFPGCKSLVAEFYKESLPDFDKIIRFESAAFKNLEVDYLQPFIQDIDGLLEKFLADQSCGNLKYFELYGNLSKKEALGLRKFYQGRSLRIHPMSAYLLEINPSTVILIEERNANQFSWWYRFYVLKNNLDEICEHFCHMLINPWNKGLSFFPRVVDFSGLFDLLTGLELEEWNSVVQTFAQTIVRQEVEPLNMRNTLLCRNKRHPLSKRKRRPN